jgi:serine/threonine protein kinase
VLIDPAGVPKIIDFGLSRLRQIWAEDAATPGMIRGTPGFLAPEQATGERQNRLGPKTDVFGLGGLLYYLLYGRPLYQGTTDEVLKKAAVADIKFNDVVRTTAIRRTLETICRQALRPKPEDRPSAEEFAQRLEAAIRAPRWPWWAGAAAVFLACVTIGWLVGKHGSEPALKPETRSASIGVRVWKGKEDVRDLIRALPVRTGDQVQLYGRVPAGMHAAFFSIDSEGQIKLMSQFAAQDKDREVAYPETQSAAIKEPARTELFLLCARRKKPVSLEEITRAWPEGPWPAMPATRSIRMSADHVVFEGPIERGIDDPGGPPRPELVVERRQEAFRQRLLEIADVFGGLAFSHR